jgi:hypothetical protein
LRDDLFLLHSEGPVRFALEDKKMNELVILLRLLGCYLLFDILLLSVRELERLAHPMKLSNAVVMISPIVIVSETILVMCGLHHDEDVNIEHLIFLLLLVLGGRIYYSGV